MKKENNNVKVAIPVFGHRVSPVFDWCLQMVVVKVNSHGEVFDRKEINLAEVLPPQRAERLAAMGVDTLLCGGISAQLTRLIEERGVRVVPWVAGEVNTVLEEFLTGNVTHPRFAMPGCNGRRRRRRRRRGWGGGRGWGGER